MVGLNYSTAVSEETLKAQLPVLTTSAGQSADVNTLNVIMEQAGVKYDYCDVPTVEMLKDGVGLGDKKSAEGFHVEVNTDLTKFKKGTPYKTIVFAIGASLKGMGASGLTIVDEIRRLKSLIDYCKKNKIFIIAVHAGGESKRGAAGRAQAGRAGIALVAQKSAAAARRCGQHRIFRRGTPSGGPGRSRSHPRRCPRAVERQRRPPDGCRRAGKRGAPGCYLQ